MSLLDELAERHIQEAVERGAFEHLPGRGQPLNLDDDSMVPPELRGGYRLLRNAGFLPPELDLKREIRDVESLLEAAQTSPARDRARKRLALLRTRLAHARGGDALLALGAYEEKVQTLLNGTGEATQEPG